MINSKNKKIKASSEGVFKSIFFAYFILLLHLLLIAGIFFMVVFFKGVVIYMPWIFLAATAAIIYSGFRVYKNMKLQGKTVREMLKDPLFSGRSVEVSILGGLARLHLGGAKEINVIKGPEISQARLEDSRSACIRELTELAMMFENQLLTEDEYNKAKNKILE